MRCQEAFLAGVSMAKQELTGIECVNTHFLPVKYWALARKRELTIATWLREAVARLIPHFDYWQRQSTTLKTAAPHHRQGIEQGWTIEQSCMSG